MTPEDLGAAGLEAPGREVRIIGELSAFPYRIFVNALALIL